VFLRYYCELPEPYEAIEPLLLNAPETWLPGLATRANHRGELLQGEIGFGRGRYRVGKRVEMRFRAPLRTPGRTVLPMTWTATGPLALFPVFEGELELGALGARVVVVGENFHFGHGRKGDVPMLAELGRSAGFEVVGLALASSSDGHPVSSTRIRGLLARGDVVGAARLLGREHQVRGKVVAGDGRGGAELGFPTANVDLPAGLALPEEGIYACRYERPDRSTHMAAVSLGRRPTFYDAGSPSLLEAYLLDFSGDLYGELAKVSFVARLRAERRFESADALVAQMGRDAAETRRLLAGQ
jgi:riboflavin kinase/FMN adenylyltransferase